MAIFKCKMCGGSLEINKNETIAECEYCGTKQTLPRLSDEKKVNLYERANHFRRNNDYDRAMGIYELILNEDTTDAEAYWSILLCRYGIEYVEDPTSHKQVPTVNRAQFTSIFDDDNYKSAIRYADVLQKEIYEKEAKEINDIQKGILTISQNEAPYDIFICYKETDKNGRRTPDSVLANDLYYQLVQEGYKVFFSRITLEDKLGAAYEPYIFAALNSAKVMVVLGTRAEYFNAVWVKNEWSRYLALIKNGAKKMLIPAYKDMDAYDLPEEFSHLQAQDMSKLGFMQDLIRGIKKIIQYEAGADTKKEAAGSDHSNTEALLKRVSIFLEDGEWKSADEYCERVLDIDPVNGEAYLGKLLAELKIHNTDELYNYEGLIEESSNYKKVVRYASESISKTLYEIKNRREQKMIARFQETYEKGVALFERAQTVGECIEAARIFASIVNYKDSREFVQKCNQKRAEIETEAIYQRTLTLERELNDSEEISYSQYEKVISEYEKIIDWKDSGIRISRLKNQMVTKKENDKKDSVNQVIIAGVVMLILLIAILLC